MKKLKRIMAVLAAVAVMITAAGAFPVVRNAAVSEPLVASAETSEDGVWEYTETNLIPVEDSEKRSIWITACYATESEIAIPSEINGLPVEYVFLKELPEIVTSITIPAGVRYFSDTTFFSKMSNLQTIVVDEDNQFFSSHNGALCNKNGTELISVPGGITDFVIPEDVLRIDSDTFNNCSSLTAITIPESVQSIGARAFSNCNNLAEITFPEQLGFIGVDAFKGTAWLDAQLAENPFVIANGILLVVDDELKKESEIVIPDTVTQIATWVFDGASMVSLTIPDSVKTIDGAAFYGCRSLKSVVIPDSVETIGISAFSNCTGLSSVTISEGITTINDNAFSSCYELATITIPDSVTTIGGEAFAACMNLEDVTMSNNIEEIRADAFRGTPWMNDLTANNSSVIFNGVLIYSDSETDTNHIVIPDGVTRIAPRITSTAPDYVVIPATVKTISRGAFYAYQNPVDIFYAGTEKEWNAIEIVDDNTTMMANSYFGNYIGAAGITDIYGTIHFNSTGPGSDVEDTTAAPALSHPGCGDADGNGEITLLDVVALNKNLMVGAPLSDEGKTFADVNQDGKLNPTDSLIILKYCVKLVDYLPVTD